MRGPPRTRALLLCARSGALWHRGHVPACLLTCACLPPQVFLNLSVISTLVLTAYKYGTNSEGVLAAVQAMAGPSTGYADGAHRVRAWAPQPDPRHGIAWHGMGST